MKTLELLQPTKATGENYLSRPVTVEKGTEHILSDMERQSDTIFSKVWKNEYDTIIENISDGIVLVDLVDRVRLINKSAVRILGINEPFEELAEKTLKDLVRTSKIDIEEIITRAKLSNRQHFKEFVFLNKRSTVFEVEVKKIFQDQDIPVGTLCFIRDISKPYNNEQKKSEFLSIVAHELFNPLAPIKEGLSLLLEESIGELNPVQKQCLHVVYEEADRLLRLVNDLLDINRLDAGKIRISRMAIDIQPLIKSVVAAIDRKASEKNITIIENIPHPILDLFADRDRMKQVLINLLDNAVKYSPNSSTVEIGAASRQGCTEITVKDQGFGISKSDIKKLFERFAQLNYPEHIQHREKGSGLGLSIVKEIIKLHHGKIKVNSEYGKGTTFTITLPKRKKARQYEGT
ncbi:PAS domain-containing protein [bacterium]|nr:PAS domain-containing protein [bacterium]